MGWEGGGRYCLEKKVTAFKSNLSHFLRRGGSQPKRNPFPNQNQCKISVFDVNQGLAEFFTQLLTKFLFKTWVQLKIERMVLFSSGLV